MKTNITLKLDATLLHEIRMLAAEEGTSISALLAAPLSKSCASARLMSARESGLWPACARDWICTGLHPVHATSFMSLF